MNSSEPRPVRYRVDLFGLVCVGNNPGDKVRVLDLSETGAFVERNLATVELQQGDTVQLILAFPGIGTWKTIAQVGRLGTSRLELKRPKATHVTVSREGFALEFVTLDDELLEQLRDFLELVDQR